MIWALLASAAASLIGVVVIIGFRWFDSGGLLAGHEWKSLVALSIVSAGVYWGVAKCRGLGIGHVVAGVLLASLFPLLTLIGPSAFCIAFMHRASCV